MEEQNQQQKAQELNRLIDTLLDKSLGVCKESQNALAELFDLLLWAQKKYLPTLASASECQLLGIVLQKYKEMPQHLLSGFTLLLGNAKDGGPLITHILQHRLGDGVLQLFLSSLQIEMDRQEDEQLHLLGSFLKAYHRHLTQNTVKFFIENDKCLLIEVCCEFFNCNEEITRTSILNILMNLLRMPWAQSVLIGGVRQRVERWARQLCCLLRNQLKDFDQNLLATQEQNGDHLVQLINDKVILWEDLSALSIIFSKPFFEQVILPLLVGSLNTSGVPLFTLKFSLFILEKMLPTIVSLKLIKQLSKLLFLPMQVRYSQRQLSTAILRPFNIQRLCQTQLDINQDEEQAEFGQTSQLFFNILRSKDSRFLEGGCRLVLGLILIIRKDHSLQSFFEQQLGFSQSGHTVFTISEILLNQFSALHAIQANRIVACLLIQLQPKKYLSEDLKNRFSHLLRKQLDQCLKDAEKYKEAYCSYICQLFEYDVRAVNGEQLNFSPLSKSDAALLFNNNVIQNDQLPFYQQLPQTPQGIIRYNLVKTLLLRRLAKIIIEEYSQEGSLERYLQRTRIMALKYVRPGEYLKLPLSCNSSRCKMVDDKMEIPNCLLLEDENSLMIGYVQSLRVKMIINIKHKHTNPVFSIKKEKIYLEIGVRKYDLSRQEMVPVKGIVIKNSQAPPEYFKTKRTNAIEREYATIVDILRRSKDSIPVMSLI